MATRVQGYGDTTLPAEVEAMAEAIRDEQHAEIFQMQQWMSDWFGTGWGQGMHDGWSGSGMMH